MIKFLISIVIAHMCACVCSKCSSIVHRKHAAFAGKISLSFYYGSLFTLLIFGYGHIISKSHKICSEANHARDRTAHFDIKIILFFFFFSVRLASLFQFWHQFVFAWRDTQASLLFHKQTISFSPLICCVYFCFSFLFETFLISDFCEHFVYVCFHFLLVGSLRWALLQQWCRSKWKSFSGCFFLWNEKKIIGTFHFSCIYFKFGPETPCTM